MSGLPAYDPDCLETKTPGIDSILDARPRDLGGGFVVRRALPAVARRTIGPFVFFDQMGPAALPVGDGLDVRPHPHIALATVTYLFDGEILHRDSLGNEQRIRPGDVNWMVAGRGIVHSERSAPSERAAGVHLHGIQSWVALPREHEEADPSFVHHPAATLPSLRRGGATLDVIAGHAYGERSPVAVLSPTLYVHARLDPGAELAMPDDHEERAVYIVEGEIECGNHSFGAGAMLVLCEKEAVRVATDEGARLMIVGGGKLDGPRHIWWNFVSSSEERIERAKDDWKSGRFPKVPGDEAEFIPLPPS